MALIAAGNWLTWEIDRKDWQHAIIADGYALRAADVLHRSQQRRAHRQTWLLESRGLAAEAGRRKNLFDLRRVAVVHNLHVIARQPATDSYQVAA